MAEGLTPFNQWLRLTNEDTYISGSFPFTIINGRKSRDRVLEEKLKILSKFSRLFTNKLPSLFLPEYYIHSEQFYTSFTTHVIEARMNACIVNPSSRDIV